MLGIFLFSSLFAVYAIAYYRSYARAADKNKKEALEKEVYELEKNLTEKGVILDYDISSTCANRYKYLKKVRKVQNELEELADLYPIFAKLLNNKAELYEVVNDMVLLDNGEINEILYRVLFMMISNRNDKAHLYLQVSPAGRLYNLLMKIKDS